MEMASATKSTRKARICIGARGGGWCECAAGPREVRRVRVDQCVDERT